MSIEARERQAADTHMNPPYAQRTGSHDWDPELWAPGWDGDAAAPSEAGSEPKPSGGSGAAFVPVNLPPDFWLARPILAKIRAAAYATGYSADAVLGAVLARTGAMASPKLRFDFGRGRGSLNMFCNLVSESGVGKTGAWEAAQDLILPPSYLAHLNGDVDLDKFKDGVGIGTGEGLAEIYMGTVERETGEIHKSGPKKGDPKTEKVRAQVRTNAFFFVDEGETLTKMMTERSGATIGPSLRSAWNAGVLGQSNAREETTRSIPKGAYSMGIVIGYQPDVAQALLADGGPGTPQRFLWMSALDPNIPRERPSESPPEPFRLELCDGRGNPVTGTITCYPELRQELWDGHIDKVHGLVVVDQLNSHVPLMRSKLAALVAVLDGRMHVTEEDWRLGGDIWATSCGVRDQLVEIGRQVAQQEHEQRTVAYVEREERAQIARDGVPAKVDRIARLIGRYVHEDGAATRGATRKRLAGRDKQFFDAAVAYAAERGWIKALDDKVLTPGDASPA